MKMKGREGLGIVVLLGLSSWLFSSFLSLPSFAAPVDFPKKEITIIVSTAAGSARDVLARGVAITMGKYLGVPMVVMNLTGGGGARGVESLYHSAADGHTIGVGMGGDIIDQIFNKREYDITKLTYIGNASTDFTHIWVKSDSAFRSVKDFKTFGKPIRFACYSLFSNSSLVSMILARREGFPLVMVGGYTGGGPAALAVIRGEVEFSAFTLSSGKPFLDAKQIRPILTFGHKERHPDFPDIQTIGELGHPDLALLPNGMWFVAPPGVAKDRIKILEDALMKTLKDPEFLKWAKGPSIIVDPLNGEALANMISKIAGVIIQYKGDIEKYIEPVR